MVACNQRTIGELYHVPKDTLKAHNEYIPMPSGADLQTQSFYFETGVYEQGNAKVIRVDILHEWQETKGKKKCWLAGPLKNLKCCIHLRARIPWHLTQFFQL